MILNVHILQTLDSTGKIMQYVCMHFQSVAHIMHCLVDVLEGAGILRC